MQTPTDRSVTRATDERSSTNGALAGLSLATLLSALGTSIANVGLPAFTEAFGASFRQVQWVVLAYLLATTTLIVSVGRLGDLAGRRRLLIAGLVLFTIASIACGMAPSLALLITARAVQGIGAAIMLALSMALVSDAVPPERTGRAMGLIGSMSAVGTALGPSLGGVLLAALGWRALFLVLVPIGALTVFLTTRALPRDRAREQMPESSSWRSFDVLGTLVLALTLGAFALAMTVGRGASGLRTSGVLLVAALIGVAGFISVEARVRAPLIHLRTLRDVRLSASLIMNVLVTTVIMATLVVGPFYLTRGIGLDAARLGLVMSVGPVVAAFTSMPAGRLVDRLGAFRATVLGLSGMTGAALLLALLPGRIGLVAYLAPMALLTASYAMFQTANNSAVMATVSSDQRGVMSGLLNLARNLGLISGAAAMGAVFARATGVADMATASAGAVSIGLRTTFAVAAALVLVALVVAVMSRRRITRLPHTAMQVASLLVLFLAIPAGGQATHGAQSVPDRATLRGAAALTVHTEVRVRGDHYHHPQLRPGHDYAQGLLRGIVGADLQVARGVHIAGEIGSGRVEGQRRLATPNFQNDASLQQLLVDARGALGDVRVGAVVGRQEFADGPRQLVSVSDGPNMHRTWNGVRLSTQQSRVRLGAFELRATRPARGDFDESINWGERLRGINASVLLMPPSRAGTLSADPFWIRTSNPAARVGEQIGLDTRNTVGVRVAGRRGRLQGDWTVARQTGEFKSRAVSAWGVFAVQSLALSDRGWKPRLTAHVDAASGGGTSGRGTVRAFHQLYASSNYLGDGLFLSSSNLLLVAPGVALSPTERSGLSAEYGVARRLAQDDAAYAGLMRPYAGTTAIGGHDIGGLLRVSGRWSVNSFASIAANYEHLASGMLLRRAGFASGHYLNISTTLRH